MMDEQAELMGTVSDANVGQPWDPTSTLATADSTGSCKVMDPFLTMGDLREGPSSEEQVIFRDSDESEVIRRRYQHKRMPDPLKKLVKKEIPSVFPLGVLLDGQEGLPISTRMHYRAHIQEKWSGSGNTYIEKLSLGHLSYKFVKKLSTKLRPHCEDVEVAGKEYTFCNHSILAFLQMVLKWKESVEMKRSGMKYKILVAREECGPEYPLIIVFYSLKGEIRASIYAPSQFGIQVMQQSLKYSKFWKDDAVAKVCEWGIYPTEAAILFLSDKSVDDRNISYPVHLYWMSPDALQIVDFEVPREFKTDPLGPSHVDTINYYWGRHRSGSEDLVQLMILHNPTIGASTFNDELSGWALQTHYGALDIVHTVNKHRRKGTARSLLLSLARTLDAEGSAAHAFVHANDRDAQNFLTKSGFTFVSEYFYFYTDPPIETSANFKDK